ncbi:MAG: methyltransferase, partial [Gammaproteobacteria bacterium]|nr:methyltransferase [Gammaproteobacteria bacterium]
RSINEWEQGGGGDDLRDAVRDGVRAILSEHYPGHITADVDAWVRKNYNIVLPCERMRPGNGAW